MGCTCNNDCHSAQKTDKHLREEKQRNLYFRPLLSFILLIGGILLNAFEIGFIKEPYVALVWNILAYLPVGLPIIKEAWESILKKDFFSEFTLMTIATMGAFYIGEYPEGVAVMLFYSIGEAFQDRAVNKARSNIRTLLDVRPETATVVREEGLVVESPEKVSVGEIIEIRVGERIPLDGKMLNEVGAFNTAALTGESIPRNIRSGEEVLAGMIATDKIVRIQVTKPYNQSALARILELVQNASERKAPAELFIRKFARIYTPIVTGLALLIVFLPFVYSQISPEFTFVFDDWLYRALVFLVISCPCALVVSIPLGYFGGIGAASKMGILFKGGNYLDAITKVNTVIFDKTGTLTKGIFEVQVIRPDNRFSKKQLLETIVSLECQSNHPIAKAIVKYANASSLDIKRVSDVMEIAGYGLKAMLDGKEICVGNIRLLDINHVSYPDSLNKIPETIICCAINGIYAGYVLLADSLKEDAQQAIDDLKKLKINHIEILSGDKGAIVSKLASAMGIHKSYGDLLPEDKVNHLERLKADPSKKIAFVGDGINDAPVLALSDIGIAMGGLGSDAAIETADVVIQTDQPSKVGTAIRIGKITRRIVWQNIALAFGVKLIVLLLGAGGLATLWEAVFADVGVALLAIFNAMRIQRLIDKPYLYGQFNKSYYGLSS